MMALKQLAPQSINVCDRPKTLGKVPEKLHPRKQQSTASIQAALPLCK